jgi:cyclopropane fatty-acyl-phospholipid synthase-like methyltransferase
MSKAKVVNNNSEKVRAFYNDNTDKFLAVYGNIIQAFRTNNVSDYLDYTIKSAKLKKGERLLDAGCGICGPALYFAEHISDIRIDACTISEIQTEKAKSLINNSKNIQSVFVLNEDYHNIDKIYELASFDCVYFLESFGHSNQKNNLIDACWNVLKPGGRLYIKDLFKRLSDDEWEQLRINQICEQINDAYEYFIPTLNEVLDKIRAKGFVLNFVKIPEVDISDFEHLKISNDFQNLFDIGKISTWDDYIFPIDFLEIYATKPKFDNLKDMHLYFMNK